MNYRIKHTTHDFTNSEYRHLLADPTYPNLNTYHLQRKLFCFWLNISPSPFYTYDEAKIALMRLLSQP